MLKSEAIAKWGVEAVELARDYYETDFGKVLFQEDCTDKWDMEASDEDQIERCSRAYRNLNKITVPARRSLAKYKSNQTESTFFVASAIAKQKKIYIPDTNSRFDREKTSHNFMTVYVGFERGMTDSGQPCWSEHGPTEFATYEAAKQMIDARLPIGYNFVLIPNSVLIHEVYKSTKVICFDKVRYDD